MSRKHVLLSLVLCFCARQLAAQSVVVLSEDGKSAWFAPSASANALKVDRVVRISTNLGGPPAPPVPPDSPLMEISATWRTKVAEYRGRDSHRQNLAGMYLLLSQQITKGTFSNIDQLKSLTKEMRNKLLGTDLAKWDQWGRDVGDYLGSHVGSLAAASEAYLAISAGLDSGEAISEQLLAFLMIILRLLLQLFGT